MAFRACTSVPRFTQYACAKRLVAVTPDLVEQAEAAGVSLLSTDYWGGIYFVECSVRGKSVAFSAGPDGALGTMDDIFESCPDAYAKERIAP